MTSDERQVNRIREFVNDFAHQATPEIHELARQFHDGCRALNERLAKCRDFLRKGMRSEAVQEALSRPSVFELAEIFSFKEREQWQDISLELGLSMAPEIDFEAVQQLKSECDKEELLDPLLHEFRRLIHTGSREERIDVLHRIRRLDPDNPVWIKNLQPLEEEQIDELTDQAESAMEAGNSEQISDILEKIQAPTRAVSPPPELIERLQKWLRQRRQQAWRKEADRLIEQLQDRLEQLDFDAVSTSLADWQRLLQNCEFEPDPEMTEIAGRAGNWLQSESNRRKRNRQFRQTSDELRRLLNNPTAPLDAIEDKWRYLQEFDEEAPEYLKEEVKTFREKTRQAEAEKRKRRNIIIGTTSLLCLILLTVLSWTAFQYYQVNQARAKMSGSWGRQEYQELAGYLQQLASNPRRYREAGAAVYKEKVEGQLRKDRERREELGRLMEELHAIKVEDFQVDQQRIANLLNNAHELAISDDEAATLAAWERDWQSSRRQRQAGHDRQLTEKITELSNDLQRIRRNTAMDLAIRIDQLSELQKSFQGWQDFADKASSEARNRFSDLAEQADSLRTELQQQLRDREEKERKQDQLLRQIIRTAGQIELWEQRVEDFIEQFPESRMAEPLRRAVEQSTAARDAVALTPFAVTQLPVTGGQIEQIENLIATLPAGRQSVWRPDLEKLITQSLRQQRLKEDLKTLRQADFYDYQRIRLREKDEEEWKTYYIPGPFHQRRFDTGNDPATRYWGPVYGLNPKTLTSETEHLSISSETHEVEFSERSSDNLIPAAAYIRQFLLRMPEESRLLEFLTAEMDQLLQDQEMALFPRAVIIEAIGNAIADFSPQRCDLSDRYRNIFSGINLDLPWFNHKNPVVTNSKAEIEKRISELPTSQAIFRQQQFNQDLLLASLSRDLSCVGMLWPDTDTENLKPILSRPELRNLWVIQTNQGRFHYQFFEINLESEEQLISAVQNRHFAGQLLFAPAENRPTEELLEELEPPPAIETVNWPQSWPINARRR